MNSTTFWIYVAMYLYGFPMIIWAIFFDKHPTEKSLKAAKIGLFLLAWTLFYFFYVLKDGIK